MTPSLTPSHLPASAGSGPRQQEEEGAHSRTAGRAPAAGRDPVELAMESVQLELASDESRSDRRRREGGRGTSMSLDEVLGDRGMQGVVLYQDSVDREEEQGAPVQGDRARAQVPPEHTRLGSRTQGFDRQSKVSSSRGPTRSRVVGEDPDGAPFPPHLEPGCLGASSGHPHGHARLAVSGGIMVGLGTPSLGLCTSQALPPGACSCRSCVCRRWLRLQP